MARKKITDATISEAFSNTDHVMAEVGGALRRILIENLLGKNVFTATYGTTTYTQVLEAYSAGRYCVVDTRKGTIYPLYALQEGTAYFGGFTENKASYLYAVNEEGWTESNEYFIKTTEISSTSTDDQVPTAKAVHTAFAKNGFSSAETDEEGYLHFYNVNGENIIDPVYVGGAGGVGFTSVAMDDAGYLHFYDDGGNDVVSAVYIGSGGSGSGSNLMFSITSGTTMTLSADAETAPVTVLFKSVDSVTSEETGAGTLQIYMDGVLKKAMTLTQGYTEIDIKEFLSSGTNSFKFIVADAYGATATRPCNIIMEQLTLSWNLEDTNKNTGALYLYITPTGTGTKTIHTLVDGVEVSTDTVTTSGQRLTVTISDLSHGAHNVECYAEKTTSSYTLTSERLVAAVAQVEDGNITPVIAAILPADTVSQYTALEIKHRVIDPENNPTTVYYLVNDVVYATEELDQSEYTWNYKPVSAGEFKLGILCGTEKWEETLTVTELGRDIQEITDGLEIKVEPAAITDLSGWSYGDYSFTLSEGFDTVNGGLQTDSEGVRYIRVVKGDTLTLNYMPFANDARKSGMDIKLVYKVENCTNFDATAISCMDGNIGLLVQANDVTCSSEQTTATMQTCEDMKTELDINIKPDSEEKTIMFWEMCCPCNPAVYADGDNFAQSTAQDITFGSEECDVCLYLMRGYSRSLTTNEIKANFYADGKDGDEILSRYERNQIYDSTGKIDVQKVQELCPNLHVLTWHATEFSLAKTSKITGDLSHIYRAGGEGHNWTAYFTVEKVQGTSSVGYAKDAGGNCDFDLVNGITLEDGSVLTAYSMSENSIPVSYFNFKANTASQEHVNNMLLSDWYNTFQPDIRPAKETDSRIRDTVESQMAVLFFHNTGTKDVQIGADLVGPDETIFYSLGNLNNSKKNYEVFGQNSDDDIIVVEVLNNTSAQSRFKSDDLADEDFGGDHNFEWRYLDDSITAEEAKEKFQELLSFVVGCDATAATNEDLAAAETYDGRAFLADTVDYRKAKWKAKAGEYLVMDSILYHQVFTLAFCMPDNRAKNTFWGYSKTRGKWHLDFAYDNDTGMGNDNEGGMTLGYGYLDTDAIGSRDVFNAADSTVFNMNREVFWDELRNMFLDRENAGAWDFDAFADLCDSRQDYACESLWIEDGERKCIRTMTQLGTTAYLAMMNSKKRLQRRKFLKFQRAFIGSYFRDAYNTSDHATIRGYTPSSWAGVAPQGVMTITPYCNMYINVLAGSISNSIRAYAGEPVEVNLGVAEMNDTEIYPRGAGFIKDLGPLAQLYPGYFDAAPLTRIVRSEVGSDAEGYSNTNFTGAAYTNCKSLQYVNHENCPNDVESLDFTPNADLRELYTRGSGVSGVKFPKNGRVEMAYLNGVSSLYVSGLRKLETLSMENYEKLSSLTVEETESIDTYALATSAENLARVRLTGIDWTVPVAGYDTLMRLHNIAGLDDDGYNVDSGVLTGKVHFTNVSETKLATLQEELPEITFTYDTMLEEHTVTFQLEDGTVLYTATTEHGGAVADPVSNGTIEVPTKAATVEYQYSFWKWDTAINYVVEDLTVTALFSETDRYYTVEFTVDGETVESYEVIAHGSCTYQGDDPTLSGYLFAGWSGDTSDIVADTVIPAEFIYPTLPAYVKDMTDYDYAYSDDPSDNSAYTKAEIAGILLGGNVSKYLAVGDQMNMVWDTDVIADTNTVFVLNGFNHYRLSDGSALAGTAWFALGLLNATGKMNETNTNVGGWPASKMRAYLNETVYPEIGPFWKSLIKQVQVRSSAGNTSAEIVYSDDYLYIPCAAEMGFNPEDVPYVNEVDPEADEVTFSLFTDNASRIKKPYNGTGGAAYWWLRSPQASSAINFHNISTNGSSNSGNAINANGVSPGFSI